jgi:hypothetical protein
MVILVAGSSSALMFHMPPGALPPVAINRFLLLMSGSVLFRKYEPICPKLHVLYM